MKIKIVSIIVAIMVLFVSCSTENGSEVEQGLAVEQEEIAESADQSTAEESSKEEAKEELAPDFTLMNLNDEEVSLSDYRGKYVLINFWATWCGICNMEMPDLYKFDNDNDDLVVLAVDVMEDKSTVEDYINEGGYDFEVVLDGDGKIAATYLVSGFPTSYFVDPDGVLLKRIPGFMTYDQMNEMFDSIRE